MKSAGAARVLCLVKENIGNEVSYFRNKYWSGEMLLDSELRFFKALAGGRPWNSVVRAFVDTVRSPVTSSLRNLRNFMTFYRSGAAMNLRGEGIIGGGCMVLSTAGSVAYSFLEQVPGEHPALEDVISAVRACQNLS